MGEGLDQRFDILDPSSAKTADEKRMALGAAGVYLSPSHPISNTEDSVQRPTHPSQEPRGGVDPDSEDYFSQMAETAGD